MATINERLAFLESGSEATLRILSNQSASIDYLTRNAVLTDRALHAAFTRITALEAVTLSSYDPNADEAAMMAANARKAPKASRGSVAKSTPVKPVKAAATPVKAAKPAATGTPYVTAFAPKPGTPRALWMAANPSATSREYFSAKKNGFVVDDAPVVKSARKSTAKSRTQTATVDTASRARLVQTNADGSRWIATRNVSYTVA